MSLKNPVRPLNAEVARKIAAQTLSEVKSAMGINYFEDTDLINSQVKKFQA